MDINRPSATAIPQGLIVPIQTKDTVHKRGKIIIWSILLGILAGLFVYMTISSITDSYKINLLQKRVDNLESNVSNMFNQLNTTTTSTNNLGMRLSKIDNQTYSPVQYSSGISPDGTKTSLNIQTDNSSNSVQVITKSGFMPDSPRITNYKTELALFKTLSPSEQYEYLNMTKIAKRNKYGSILP